MATITPWEYFIRVLCQLEIESELVTGRLHKLEQQTHSLQTAIAIFAPASAAAGLLNWADPWPEFKQSIYLVWNCMVWLTAVLAVPLASLISPRARSVRELANQMQTLLASGRAILGSAHYVDVESDEWTDEARDFTDNYNRQIIFCMKFSGQDVAAARDGIVARYDDYLLTEENENA